MRRATRRWTQRILILSLVAFVGIGVWSPSRSSAADDMEWETTLTYQLKVDEGTVNLVSDVEITNKKGNRRDGNSIIQYYFDRIWIYVPEEAENLAVTSSGKELEYTVEEEVEKEDDIVGLDIIEIRFGKRLFYNRSIEIRVEYDLPGDDPRSESLFRVNPAYASFSVISWGDPGHIEVNVILDDQFDVVAWGSDYDISRDGSNVVYTMTGIEDPEEWFMVFTARNDDELDETDVDLADFDVKLRAWPSDQWWASEIEGAVEEGLPVLHELVGLAWRPEEELEIRESIEPNLLGYGGWYLDGDDVIEIGEFVDRHLVLHEIGHSWFDSDLFVERWITEGLADRYAWEAVRTLDWEGSTEFEPPDDPPARDGILTPPLNDWTVPNADEIGVNRTEEYGYAMSWWLIDAITDEIGVEALSAVIAAADADEIAYRSGGPPEAVDAEDDWRRFLDLAQEIGGSTEAPTLFDEYVLGEDESLDERTAARGEYARLEKEAKTWATPLLIRQPMSDWDFVAATTRIEEASSVLDLRDEIETITDELGVRLPPSLEEAYEAADGDFSAATALAQDQLEAAAAVLAAKETVESEPTLLATIGLIGEDPDLEYQEAAVALENDLHEEAIADADQVVVLLAAAEDVGMTRVIKASVALVALLVLITVVVVMVIRRSRRRVALESGPADEDPPSA